MNTSSKFKKKETIFFYLGMGNILGSIEIILINGC